MDNLTLTNVVFEFQFEVWYYCSICNLTLTNVVFESANNLRA